jgi:hypothetical protein
MKTTLKRIFLIALSTACLGACGHKSTPAPAQPAANPSADEPAAVAAAPAKPAGMDGRWEGNSGPDMPMSFSVAGNQVSDVYASLKAQKGNCSIFGSFGADGVSTLSGKSFTAHGKHEQFEYTVNGTFTSDSEASGTIDWKTATEVCGPYDTQLKWTAKKGAAAPADEDE